jgi:hypothetical protein
MTLHSTLLMLTICVLSIGVAQGQTTSANSTSNSIAKANVPLFTDYRGVKIGMSADEVRSKLDQLKKGEGQDFLVLSDQESAQIYYDNQGKVTAISIDYFNNGKAPSPDAVLGIAIQAKEDGSMYQLNRYPEAGYWVSYNRTAGEKPIVTITMQKM